MKPLTAVLDCDYKSAKTLDKKLQSLNIPNCGDLRTISSHICGDKTVAIFRRKVWTSPPKHDLIKTPSRFMPKINQVMNTVLSQIKLNLETCKVAS